MASIILEGRRTGQGAYTSCQSGVRFGYSKTGNHWQEKITLEEGESTLVVDISNSGKHNCYVLICDKGVIQVSRRNSSRNWPCICGK